MSSPLQGSFFTRNSSRAIQPPPTRTITVLRKIRTRRSCCESPNYGEERERVRHVDHHSRQERKKKTLVQIRRSYWLGGIKSPMQQHNTHTHTDSLCKFRNHFFSMLHRFTQRGLKHILRFHSRQHKLHKGHSNWFISSMLVSFCTFLLAFLQCKYL